MVKDSLKLVTDFVNTLDLGDGEELATPAALRDWLAGQGLLERGRATRADLERALRLREALRDLLLANNDVDSPVVEAARTLDELAGRARLQLRFEPGGAHAEPGATGVDGALGHVLAAVSATMADGSWSRLKACRADDCKWVFVDRARNGSRAWCSMRSCGNRAKARAYRERHR